MQKLIITTYATENHYDHLLRFSDVIGKYNFDHGYPNKYVYMDMYTRIDLVTKEFYKKNKELLDEKTGAGYWIWKPFFILESLKHLGTGDILMYADCGDKLVNLAGMREFLFERMKHTNVLLTDGAFRHGNWTKRDCFVAMDCDTEYYHDAIQLEAGIVVCKNTPETVQFIQQWLNWCQDGRIMRYNENILGKKNLPGFKEHRGDQSVLTNLFLWNKSIGTPGIESSGEMRPYVHCNQNN